jgi:SPP1 gp7 family putative phage head morphogenesis protein
MQDRVPSRVLARQIKETGIGLTPRLAQAVRNFEERLVEQGLSEETIFTRTKDYYGRLLNYRAKMIADTESIMAVNQGQFELWDQAADEGFFDRTQSGRMWVVTPDDKVCSICRPMDGKIIPFNDMYEVIHYTETGRVTAMTQVLTPPAHPNCRCAMAFVIDITAGIAA